MKVVVQVRHGVDTGRMRMDWGIKQCFMFVSKSRLEIRWNDKMGNEGDKHGRELTHSDPFVVVVLSLSFIASIFFLHIAAKLVRVFTK